MTVATLASLAMDFDVRSADPAKAKTDALTAAAAALEAQAKRTESAVRQQAVAQGLSGTAAGQAERTMRGLVEVYGTAYNASSRFAMSQDATAKMMLQNAKATDALQKQQERSAKQVEALTRAYDPLGAEVLKTNRQIAEAAKLQGENGAAVEGLRKKLENLHAAQNAGVKSGTALQNATLNLGRQFTDIGVQLSSGQSFGMVLIQQGPQIADAFAMASQQGLGFKAVVAGIVAETRALLLTFGPWIAGLAAVGAAVWYVVDAHNKQVKAVKDLTDALDKQHKELQGLAPFLFQANDNANLAAEGQRNFEAWLKKTNISIAEQNRLLRENALADLNAKSLKAADNLRNAQEQFDKAKQAGPTLASAGGVGSFGVVAAPVSRDPTENPLYKAAEANLKKARADADTIAKLLAQAGQAPDSAFGDANRKSASTPRDMTDERAAQLSKDIATARAAELQAQMALTKDVEARADYERQIIQAESAARQAELAGKIAAIADDKGLSDTKKKELRAGYEALASTEKRVADLKVQAIDQGLVSQLLQAELASRRDESAYLDKMAKFAAETAPTVEARNAIELASLKRRQGEEAYALAASNVLKVSSGEISAMAAAEAELRQKNLAFAQTEAALRAQGNEIIERDLRLRQEGLQNDIDVLQSRQGIAQSEYEAARVQRQIIEKRYDGERLALEAVLAKTGVDADTLRVTKDRLSVLEQIKANELKQLEQSQNMITAMTSAINAIDQTARAFKSGDIGAGISGLSKSLSNISGLLGSSSGLGKSLGGIADFLGPIGGLVSGVTSLFGGLFGGSSKKKKARAAAAAQAAAEEAQRQQTIADTEFGLNVALLRAQGKETEATNKEREKEIARLQGISQASADMQKQLYALEDAATAAATAAEKAATVEARRSSIQDEIDKLTMSSADLLAKTRAKERAEAVALDPTLGDLIDKLYGLQDSATASQAATAALQAANDTATAAMERQAAAQQVLLDQQNAFITAGKTAADTFRDLAKNLTDFANSLGGGTSGVGSYAGSRNAFLKAQGADVISAGQAFLAASEAGSSSLNYQFDTAVVRSRALQEAKLSTQEAKNQEFGAMLIAAVLGGQTDVFSRLSGLPGFANGGSAIIGGLSGVDQNVLSINGQPQLRVGAGELLSVTPRGASNDNGVGALRTEIVALRQELSEALSRIANNTEETSNTLRHGVVSTQAG